MIIAFILYILAMLLIGVGASYLTKNLDDYILGGRNLSAFVSALSAGASDMSGWLMMALPGAVYTLGVSQAWIALSLLIGAYLNWRLVAKRLRIYTEKLDDALTIPVYLQNRFEDKTQILPRLSSLMILVFFTVYTAASFHASAVLFDSTFGLPYFSGLFLGFFSIVSYVLIGGFIGVCWTDTVQGVLVFAALIFLPIAAWLMLKHNHVPIYDSIVSARSVDFFNPFYQQNSIGFISFLGWGLGYFGQPHILVRFMAIRRPRELKVARRIGISWMALSLLGAVAVGILAVPYFASNPLADPESAFIKLSHALFSNFLSGLLLAAVLSAIMSTASSQLIILSSVVAEDFYRPLRPQATQRELLWIGRMAVAILACLSFILACQRDSSVLSIVSYAWAGLGATFGPIILFSVFWKKMSRWSAVAAIPVGGITVILWESMSSLGGIFQLYSIIPGFILASIAVVGVSCFGRNKPSKNMQDTFDAVQVAYRHA